MHSACVKQLPWTVHQLPIWRYITTSLLVFRWRINSASYYCTSAASSNSALHLLPKAVQAVLSLPLVWFQYCSIVAY